MRLLWLIQIPAWVSYWREIIPLMACRCIRSQLLSQASRIYNIPWIHSSPWIKLWTSGTKSNQSISLKRQMTWISNRILHKVIRSSNHNIQRGLIIHQHRGIRAAREGIRHRRHSCRAKEGWWDTRRRRIMQTTVIIISIGPVTACHIHSRWR